MSTATCFVVLIKPDTGIKMNKLLSINYGNLGVSWNMLFDSVHVITKLILY